ncbi:MAG: hypothetical protein K0R50_1090 [Eubacterium sp.]|nr:hypothetical protein [Eubacterium sp.]
MIEFKGSILELNNKQAIVLTDKCEFISIKRLPEMFVGQQLAFKKSDIKRRTKSYIRYAALIASIFVLALISLLYFQVYNTNTVFAYIDVDINPSLEFKIDNNSNVLGVKALNSDARTLLKELQLKKIPVKEAISKVIEASKELGFISTEKNNEVLVSATLESEQSNKSNTDKDKTLDTILSDIKTISVQVGTENLKPEVLKVTPENRKSAVKNDISMGRYELYKKIKQKNPEITIEKAKSERVSEMLDKAAVKKSHKSDKKNPSLSKSKKDKENKNSEDNKKSDNYPGDKNIDESGKHNKSENSEDEDKNKNTSKSESKTKKNADQKIKSKDKNNNTKNDKKIKSNKNKSKSQSKSDWPSGYSDKNSVKENSGTNSDKNSSKNNNSKNQVQDKTDASEKKDEGKVNKNQDNGKNVKGGKNSSNDKGSNNT